VGNSLKLKILSKNIKLPILIQLENSNAPIVEKNSAKRKNFNHIQCEFTTMKEISNVNFVREPLKHHMTSNIIR
jgi:hypothetical protein